MKVLSIVGTTMSTMTLIAMSTIGVNAYNSNVLDMRPDTTAILAPSQISFMIEDVVSDVIKSSELDCLALNIYHEAMGESELGQRAVAYVTINRTHDDRYSNTICEVVYQARTDANGDPIRNRCQFSWFCDGKSDEIKDEEAYARALWIASNVINTYGNSFDPTMGATMYHTHDVAPFWLESFDKTTEIENHIFYKIKG